VTILAINLGSTSPSAPDSMLFSTASLRISINVVATNGEWADGNNAARISCMTDATSLK
jgi:hypothetical protein